MRAVNVALLGACGWMGKCHSLGYRNAALLFPEKKIMPTISWLVDADDKKAKALQPIYGDARVSTDWREAIADPAVDLVDISLPDQLHYEASKAALLAGKHVYCEKPFTSTPAEAAELAAMAAERGLVTRIGHNFPKNPVHDLAKEIIDSGEIGELVLFRASMHVDVLADPNTPFMWRCDGELTPTGVVGDVASHVFSYIQRLIGPVEELIADTVTTTKTRPYVEGFGYGVVSQDSQSNEKREVTNPDLVTVLCTFAGGGRGVIDVSRVASGRRFLQNYEIYGTKGGLEFRNDEVNRLRFFDSSDPANRQGYRAIDVGPENPNFKAFLPVANFGLGYNEFKAIEIAEVVESVATGKPAWPTFADGQAIMNVVDACFRSSRERRWVKV